MNMGVWGSMDKINIQRVSSQYIINLWKMVPTPTQWLHSGVVVVKTRSYQNMSVVWAARFPHCNKLLEYADKEIEIQRKHWSFNWWWFWGDTTVYILILVHRAFEKGGYAAAREKHTAQAWVGGLMCDTCWGVTWAAWTGTLLYMCCPSAADAERCSTRMQCRPFERTPTQIADISRKKWHPIQRSPSQTDELVMENVIHLTSSAAILTTWLLW